MTRATEQLLLLHHTESIFTRRIRASINEVQGQLAESVESPLFEKRAASGRTL